MSEITTTGNASVKLSRTSSGGVRVELKNSWLPGARGWLRTPNNSNTVQRSFKTINDAAKALQALGPSTTVKRKLTDSLESGHSLVVPWKQMPGHDVEIGVFGKPRSHRQRVTSSRDSTGTIEAMEPGLAALYQQTIAHRANTSWLPPGVSRLQVDVLPSDDPDYIRIADTGRKKIRPIRCIITKADGSVERSPHHSPALMMSKTGIFGGSTCLYKIVGEGICRFSRREEIEGTIRYRHFGDPRARSTAQRTAIPIFWASVGANTQRRYGYTGTAEQACSIFGTKIIRSMSSDNRPITLVTRHGDDIQSLVLTTDPLALQDLTEPPSLKEGHWGQIIELNGSLEWATEEESDLLKGAYGWA